MTNKVGTTNTTTTITEIEDNALIILANGYYSTTSKISVPIETLRENISVLNYDNMTLKTIASL